MGLRYYSRKSYSYGSFWGTYPVVKILIIINIAVFILQELSGHWIDRYFVLNLGYGVYEPSFWKGYIWQLFTYMFLHGNFFHILFNMFVLWMFGRMLEPIWGSKRFLTYYFVCGVGAGICIILFSGVTTLGASGAIFGVLLAFGVQFPNQIVYMSFIFPIKAKYLVLLYGGIELFLLINDSGGNISHVAHLGGLVFGFFFLRGGSLLQNLRDKFSLAPKEHVQSRPTVVSKPVPAQHKGVGESFEHRKLRERVDLILDKINEVGYDNLTSEEKEILVEASKVLKDKKF